MIYTSKEEAKALAPSIKILSNINNKFYMVSKNNCVRATSNQTNSTPIPIFQFFDEMDEEDFRALEQHYSNFALKGVLEEANLDLRHQSHKPKQNF